MCNIVMPYLAIHRTAALLGIQKVPQGTFSTNAVGLLDVRNKMERSFTLWYKYVHMQPLHWYMYIAATKLVSKLYDSEA